MFVFGEDGIINRAEQAKLETEIAGVRERLEMAEASAMADGAGRIDMDHYWEILEDEDIIGSKDTDVSDDDGDGTYEVVTDEGFIFDITPLPDEENTTDIVIDYVGTAEGPRISKIVVTEMTSNSVTIKVETTNANKGEYTYEYRKVGEESWTAIEGQGDTCKIEGLEQGQIYEVRVTVETNQGTATKIEEVKAGELTDAPIEFSAPTWNGGKASITVSTTAGAEYKLQYQIGGKEEESWIDIANGGTIDNLSYNETVYARLFDGVNGTDPASATIKDNNPPTVTVTEGTITSNSIGVSVTATDGESGMSGSLTYTYYIKQSSEADTAYTTPSGASNITANTYTFTGLTQGTSYDVKVEVTGDNAGNTGTGTLQNKTTSSIPGGTDATVSGAITFGTPTWSNGTASITVSTNTSYQIEYQVGGTTGTWTSIANNGTISGVSNGTTVYARLTDGVNVGDYASVTISDTTGPTVSLSTSATYNSITVTVNASDSGSGLATTDTYKYYINNESTPRNTSTSNSYTFSGLSAQTGYSIKVEVADKLNNIGTGTASVTTPKKPAENINEVGEAEYVNYVDNNGNTWLCAVLYDSNSPYGVQIITMDDVEQVHVGTDDYIGMGTELSQLTEARNSYNNCINLFNSTASKYLNTTYATSARSVGSNPSNPNSDPGYFSPKYSYFSQNGHGSYKNSDENYIIDYEQMQKLGILSYDNNGGGGYVLATRYIYETEYYTYLGVRRVYTYDPNNIRITDEVFIHINDNSLSHPFTVSHSPENIRAVFTLRSNVKITGGSGTRADPYTLGV